MGWIGENTAGERVRDTATAGIRMKVIGIAGGVASGKSTVTKLLSDRGAAVLDADRAGHEVLRDQEVKQLILDRWGNLVFDSSGEVDRGALAQIVFAESPSGKKELADLETITHPRIKQRLVRVLSDLRQRNCRAAVLDAPVMFKAGWDEMCDFVVFVDTPRARRLTWATERGWTEAEFEARERSQVPLDQKRLRSNYFVENSGSVQQLSAQVNRFWDENVNQNDITGV